MSGAPHCLAAAPAQATLLIYSCRSRSTLRAEVFLSKLQTASVLCCLSCHCLPDRLHESQTFRSRPAGRFVCAVADWKLWLEPGNRDPASLSAVLDTMSLGSCHCLRRRLKLLQGGRRRSEPVRRRCCLSTARCASLPGFIILFVILYALEVL